MIVNKYNDSFEKLKKDVAALDEDQYSKVVEILLKEKVPSQANFEIDLNDYSDWIIDEVKKYLSDEKEKSQNVYLCLQRNYKQDYIHCLLHNLLLYVKS